MPQPIARPAHEPSTGVITAASPGPSSWTPTSGLITVPPCTSWSYWRTTHSLLHTLGEARTFSRASVRFPSPPPGPLPHQGGRGREAPPASEVGAAPRHPEAPPVSGPAPC